MGDWQAIGDLARKEVQRVLEKQGRQDAGAENK